MFFPILFFDIDSSTEIGIGALQEKTTTLSQIHRIKCAKTVTQRKALRTEFGISAMILIHAWSCLLMSISMLVSFAPCCELYHCFAGAHQLKYCTLCYWVLIVPILRSRLSSVQRGELSARIAAFSLSGFDKKLLLPFQSPTEVQVWLALSKVTFVVFFFWRNLVA